MSIDDLRAKSRALRNSRLPTYPVTMRSYGGVRVRVWLTIPKVDGPCLVYYFANEMGWHVARLAAFGPE